MQVAGNVEFDRQSIADHASQLASGIKGNLARSLEALGVVSFPLLFCPCLARCRLCADSEPSASRHLLPNASLHSSMLCSMVTVCKLLRRDIPMTDLVRHGLKTMIP